MNFCAHLCSSYQHPSLTAGCSRRISNIFLSLEGEKHLSCLSFENRATPQTIRAGTGEMCAENSQGAEALGLRRFSFPCLASKNKGIPEKIRAGPHPKPTLLLLLLLLPPPHCLSLSLTHTHTHSIARRTHRYPGNGLHACMHVCVFWP